MSTAIVNVADCILYRFDAIRMAREWVASLEEQPPRNLEGRISVQPRYPMDDILSIMNPDIRKPFDMYEVLLRLVDDSRVSVFKPKYGRNLVTAFAQIHGMYQPCKSFVSTN